MSAPASDTSAPAGGSPVDGLRRLKEVETETEARLAAAREAAQRKVAALREQLEAEFHELRRELEHRREGELQAAREGADREAAAILENGRRAVQALEGRSATLPPERHRDFVKLVLGDFLPDADAE